MRLHLSRSTETDPHFDVDLCRESVVVCGGELDLAAVPTLRDSFDTATTRSPEHVVLDLTDVTFMDCSALGEVVRARSALRARGDDLTVRGLSAAAGRVCAIVGIDLSGDEHDDDRPELDTTIPTATIREIVDMWRSQCRSSLGHAELVEFHDPADLLSRIITAVVDPAPLVAPDSLADIAASCSSIEETDAALVVLQLIALGNVLRTWFGDPAMTSRLHVRLNTVIEALVGSALHALVDIGLVDPLTGLRNRRALDQDLVRFLAAARRREQVLSVVMIDIEGLKAVNDRLGHAAGDDLLKGVAQNLTATCRAGDHVYRIGGDEFVFVLPDLGPDHIEAMMLRTIDGTAATFTWGCAWTEGVDTGGDLDRATSLLEAADRRMLDFQAMVRSSDVSRRGGSGPDSQRASELAGQIRGGVRTNAAIEQATGMLAQYFGAAPADALDILLVMARDRDEDMGVTARLLIDGRIRAETLTSGASAGSDRSDTGVAPAGPTDANHGS